MSSRRYRVLGGLEVIEESGRLELGTRKQRALLGVLLLADGHPVSTDRLIDAIWGATPPERVEASLQSYVSTLRRALEPDRPPRAPARVLVTSGHGYALKATREQVDAWRFADLLEEGRAQHAAGRLGEAATTLRNALAMYAPLLPEFDGEPFQQAPAQHLERLHLVALELSYQVRLGLGEHQVLVADLETAVSKHPLHEGLWALLATARYRVGRQSDALRAIADAKALLAEEIGVDIGPRLRRLETDILHQAAHLDPPTIAPPTVGPPTVGPQSPAALARLDRDAAPSAPEASAPHLIPVRTPHPDGLVGRQPELAAIDAAVRGALAGRDALVLVEGEPGAGKTRLLEEAFAGAAEQATLLWGSCLDGDGSPSLWPWVQVMNQVQALLSEQQRQSLIDSDLGRIWLHRRSPEGTNPAPRLFPDSDGRFLLFDDAGDLMNAVAGRQPLIIVLDDLQWADPTSLELFVHLAARRPARVVLAATLRDRAPAPDDALRAALAALSRLPGHRRIRLGPLTSDDVAQMIEQQTGDAPDAATAETVRDRSAGNPFFVRELLRAGQHRDREAPVPSSVRDVVRDRVEQAGAATKELLQLAALVGRDVQLGLLARAADLDVEACLTRLEPAEELGLLTQPPGDPFSFRFEHDIVRESIAETTPPLRGVRLHLRIADALEATSSGDDVSERLAHHLWSAGPLAAPVRTARALVDAGRQAGVRYAYGTAQRHLEGAVAIARSGGETELELEGLGLLVRVVGVRQGYVGATLELTRRAEELAGRLGLDRQAGDFLYSRWSAHSQRLDLAVSSALATQLREQAEVSDDPLLQLYGHHAWGVDQWDHGNIGAAYLSLQRAAALITPELAESARARDVLRYELQRLSPAFLALMTALHGDVQAARELFDRMEADLGGRPYPTAVWGAFSTSAAAMAGEPEWARAVGGRCIAADPQPSFAFLGAFLRIQYWWAEALLAEHPAEAAGAAARIDELLRGMPADSPRSGDASWWSLLAEAELAAGHLEAAGAALGQAERSMGRHGQMYPEPLMLLVRAAWQHACGAPPEIVAGTLDAVRSLATEREAFLFVQRADDAARRLGI